MILHRQTRHPDAVMLWRSPQKTNETELVLSSFDGEWAQVSGVKREAPRRVEWGVLYLLWLLVLAIAFSLSTHTYKKHNTEKNTTHRIPADHCRFDYVDGMGNRRTNSKGGGVRRGATSSIPVTSIMVKRRENTRKEPQ